VGRAAGIPWGRAGSFRSRRFLSRELKSREPVTADGAALRSLGNPRPHRRLGDRRRPALKPRTDWIFPPRDEIHRPVAALLKAQTEY
jgi:hypothetical protein